MSDTLSKVDIATLHLRYKIENTILFDRFSSLGIMTVGEISRDVLNSVYPTEDVLSATVDCVKSGHLDSFYLVNCLKCKGVSYIKEEDISKSLTLVELINDGPQCHHCSAKLTQDPKDIDIRFAIPQRFLPELSESEGVTNVVFFKRFMKWVGFRK